MSIVGEQLNGLLARRHVPSVRIEISAFIDRKLKYDDMASRGCSHQCYVLLMPRLPAPENFNTADDTANLTTFLSSQCLYSWIHELPVTLSIQLNSSSRGPRRDFEPSTVMNTADCTSLPHNSRTCLQEEEKGTDHFSDD